MGDDLLMGTVEDEDVDVAGLLGTRLVSGERLAGGYSHETRLLTCTDGRVVVRFGGGDPRVEAAVMRAASEHVPVPEVLRVEACHGEHHRPFMALELVEGVLLQDVLSRTETRARVELAEEVGAVAARVGGHRFETPGFFADETLSVPPERPWSEQLPEVAASAMDGTDRLPPAVRTGWVRLCADHAGELVAVDPMARLVHSDLNPKNLLVRRDGGRWRVAALLDWEFAYAGCPYGDPANMARFGDDYPDGFLRRFRHTYAEHAPELADRWQRIGRVLDMFSLSALVTRPAGHPIADRAAQVVREWVAGGLPRDD